MTRRPSFRIPLHHPARSERGVALLMTLFIVLIVAAVILQLALTTTADFAVSVNESVVARVEAAADTAFVDARKALLDDAQQSQDSGGGPGSAMAGGGSPIPGAGGGDPSQQQADNSDSLNDPWAKDQETSVNDIQVRVHIEDENRKFNVLTLVSKDQEFARASRERLVRIIDYLREFNGTERDIDSGSAETIVANIVQWLEGNRKGFERPTLHSNAPDSTVTLMVTLDELLAVEGIDEELLYDQRVNGVDYPGLESVLTIYTSLEAGPLKTNENSNSNPTADGSAPGTTPGDSASSNQTPGGSGSGNPAGGNSGSQQNAPAEKGKDPSTEPGKSLGVKININTAPPSVLRALAPSFDIPTDVWDAVIRYRNQLDEEKLKQSKENGDYLGDELPAGVDPATKIVDKTAFPTGEGAPATHIFSTLEDLNKVEEWKNLGNETAKKEVLKLLTTESDVFSIYIAARPTSGVGATRSQGVDAFGFATTTPGSNDPDDMPGGIVRRIRQVVWRRKGTSETVLLPVVVREERWVRKVSVNDFPIDKNTGQPSYR